MSRTVFVEGVVPVDDDWRKMKAIADACDAANICWPREVDDFFGDQEIDLAGLVIDLQNCCRDCGDMDRDGFEIDVADIPEKVKTIRVCETW